MNTLLNTLQKQQHLEGVIRQVARFFARHPLHYGHGTQTPRDEAVYLVFEVCGLAYDCEHAALARPPTAAEAERIAALAAKRVDTRKPLAYLLNKAYFAGLSFYVDEGVFIPRSPIAELIAAQFQPWIDPRKVHRIVDLCTGSGSIAIACAKAFPHAEVYAVELSPEAFKIAQRNVKDHQVKVTVLNANLFEALPPGPFDIIVSNPPYVSHSEMQTLPTEYTHEPRMALEAADEGMSIALEILKRADEFLSPHGIAVVEVGNTDVTLQTQHPELPIVWLEFENGGHGVFLYSKQGFSI